MKLRLFAILLASIGLLLGTSVPARAHHSFGVEYDVNKPVTLTGVITKIEWTNPHSFVFIDIKDASGKVTNWRFEGYPPTVLYRTGWKRDVTMKAGDEITVYGWQSRVGGPWGHARQITFADGKKLYFGPGPGTGDGGASLPVAVPPSN
jgi:DNA/RNA endonuclease YhcR with UshA esterase domain